MLAISSRCWVIRDWLFALRDGLLRVQQLSLGAPKVNPETLTAFAMNYALVRPMMRELAALSLHGRLHGVAEDPAVQFSRLRLARGGRALRMGCRSLGRRSTAGQSATHGGCADWRVGPERVSRDGLPCASQLDVTDGSRGAKMQFARVEEGTFQDDGTWKFLRVWNGDQTDWGLNFTSAPQV